MTRRFKSILLICVILMQVTVLAHFSPLNVYPNYTLVILVAMGLINPEVENVIIAGVIGFVSDILTGAPLGVNTLLYIYLVIFCIIISEAIYNKRVTLFIPVCFAGCFVYELLFGIFSCLIRKVAFAPYLIFKIVLPSAAVNTVIFVFVYEILRRLRFEKKKRGIKYER